MTDILGILKALGIEVPEDKAEELASQVVENYRTINDYNRLRAKVNDLTASLNESNAALDEAKRVSADPDEVAKLKATIAEYQTKDEQRKKAEADSKAREQFETEFDAAVGDKQFANDIVRNAIADRAFEMKRKNPDMQTAGILAAIVGNSDGVWKNPQQDPKKMPATSDAQGTSGVGEIQNLEDVERMTPEQINEHWDEVSKILSSSKE